MFTLADFRSTRNPCVSSFLFFLYDLNSSFSYVTKSRHVWLSGTKCVFETEEEGRKIVSGTTRANTMGVSASERHVITVATGARRSDWTADIPEGSRGSPRLRGVGVGCAGPLGPRHRCASTKVCFKVEMNLLTRKKLSFLV